MEKNNADNYLQMSFFNSIFHPSIESLIKILQENELGFPTFANQAILILFFFQNLSYLVKNQYDLISTRSYLTLGSLILNSNIANSLIITESAFFFEVCFFFSNFIIYFPIFFISFIFFNIQRKQKISILNPFFAILVKVFCLIIYLHPWILFLPINDIFLNLFEQHNFSFYQFVNFDNNLFFSIIIILGSAFNIFLGFFAIWINRNPNFIENKSLKFDFGQNAFFCFFIRILLSLLSPFLNGNVVFFLILQLFFVFEMFYICCFFPIRNKDLCKFFFGLLFFSEILSFCLYFWEFSDLFDQNSSFYIVLLLMPICLKLGRNFFDFRSHKISFDEINSSENPIYCLEEIIGNLKKNIKEDESLFEGFICHHLRKCKEIPCSLLKKQLNDMYGNEEHLANKLVLLKFKNILKKEAKKNRNFGYFLLKFMNFLVMSNLNPVKSFLEIQKAMSYYTKNEKTMLISVYIEFWRKKIQEKLKKTITNESNISLLITSEIKLEKYYKIIELQSIYEKELKILINEKRVFWEKYQNQITKSKDLIDISSILLRKIELFKEKLIYHIGKTPPEKAKMLIQIKYLSIFHCTLVNSMNEAFKYQELYQSFLKSEATNQEKVLQTLSFLDEDIAICLVSFLKQEGKIMEESKNEKLAHFFGYTYHEFQLIRRLEVLMPKYLAFHHGYFISHFFKKSSQEIDISNRFIESFGVCKNDCIFPLRIFHGYNFDYKEDFVMIAAFIRKDSLSEKNYDWLCDDSGGTIGISQDILQVFKEKYDFFDISQANQMILPCLIPEIKLYLEKMKENRTMRHEQFKNQVGWLYFPENLKEILEVMMTINKEMTASKKIESSIYSKTLNTIKSYKSDRFSLKQNFPNNKFIQKTLLEEENDERLKIQIFEQEMGNKENMAKVQISFDFYLQSHRIGPEDDDFIMVNHLKIKTIKISNDKKLKNGYAFERKFIERPEINESDRISDTNGLYNLMPNENRLNLKKIFARENSNEIKVFNIEEQILETKNDKRRENEEIIEKNQPKSFELENLSSSSSPQNISQKHGKTSKSHLSSSFSDRKTSYLTFNTIKEIQNCPPVFLRRIFYSLNFEILLIIIYFSILMSLYQGYVTNTYQPIQKSIINIANIATSLSYSTAMFTEIEYHSFNITNRTLSPFKRSIWSKIFNQNFKIMKNFNFNERNMPGNLLYQYQKVYKTVENDFVDFDDIQLEILEYADCLDLYADLIFLTIDDFDEFLDFNEKISPQRNYPYLISSTSIVYLAAKTDFQNTNEETTQNFMILLIGFILFNFCFKFFQLYNLLAFHGTLVEIINVFQRCNIHDSVKELHFLQEISHILNQPFMQTNFPEKTINNQRNSTKRIAKAILSQKQIHQNSLTKMNALPKTMIFIIIIFLLIISMVYYCFNYYFWINNNVIIGNLININTFFTDVYGFSTSIMGLNILAIREKIVRNPAYEALNDPYQNHDIRSSFFYSNLIERLDIMGNSTAFSLPQYTIQAKNSMNNIDFDTLVMSDICGLLLKNGVLNDTEEEMAFCENAFHGAFLLGILPLLNEYIQEIKEFIPYIEIYNDNETLEIEQQKENVFNLINSQEYEDFIFSYYYFHNTLLLYYNLMNDYYTGVMDGEMTKLYLFLIFTSIFCSLGFVLFAIYLNKKLERYYKFVALSLSLIPYEKIVNDGQIKFLIVNLWKKNKHN